MQVRKPKKVNFLYKLLSINSRNLIPCVFATIINLFPLYNTRFTVGLRLNSIVKRNSFPNSTPFLRLFVNFCIFLLDKIFWFNSLNIFNCIIIRFIEFRLFIFCHLFKYFDIRMNKPQKSLSSIRIFYVVHSFP